MMHFTQGRVINHHNLTHPTQGSMEGKESMEEENQEYLDIQEYMGIV